MVEFGTSSAFREWLGFVKPVRRACARSSKFGQDASLTQRPVAARRAQCERNAGLLA